MNLTALQYLEPYEVNNTLINDSSQLAANLVDNANTQTGGYFGLGMLIILFIFFLIMFMSENDFFRLDFISALNLSSGLCLLLGIIFIVSEVITNFQHVVWFGIIFILGLLAKYNSQR